MTIDEPQQIVTETIEMSDFPSAARSPIPNRRDFLKGTSAAVAAGTLAGQLALSGGFTNVLTLFDGRAELEEISDGLTQHIADRYHFMIQG